MEQFKEFVVKYFKIIVVVLSFSLTLYIQNWRPNVSVWKWKSRTSMTASTP